MALKSQHHSNILDKVLRVVCASPTDYITCMVSFEKNFAVSNHFVTGYRIKKTLRGRTVL